VILEDDREQSATRRFILPVQPLLEQADQISPNPERHKKANPGQAELDGADIGFVRRAVGMVQDSHRRLPLFMTES